MKTRIYSKAFIKNEMGKEDFKIVEENGRRILKCGTPLAFSDFIEGELSKALTSIANRFSSEVSKVDYDDVKSITSDVEDIVLGMIGCDGVDYESTEY